VKGTVKPFKGFKKASKWRVILPFGRDFGFSGCCIQSERFRAPRLYAGQTADGGVDHGLTAQAALFEQRSCMEKCAQGLSLSIGFKAASSAANGDAVASRMMG
jgi:hypothetical protein